jgi:SAM-dependent methyltransferase
MYTPETKQFFENTGWNLKDGVPVDQIMFGNTEMGPLRKAIQDARMDRVKAALRQAGKGLNLLEAGCGGTPETGLLDLCSFYTGVDISPRGIEVANAALGKFNTPYALNEADLCKLPFGTGTFDAVYSAHVLYHIADPQSQAAAFRELARVLRPGGVLVLLLANPRPLLFPGRLVRRLIADTPVVGTIANRLRAPAPVPYKPMTIEWMRRQLEPFGKVEVSCNAIETTWFNQHVSEFRNPGARLWQWIALLERDYAPYIANLGAYVQIVLKKTK